MKRLLATTLLSLVCFVAHAEWVYLNFTGKGKVYVDPKSKKRDGDVARIWILTDYFEGQRIMYGDRQIVSDKAQEQFNCREDTYRLVSLVIHPEAMGMGMTLASHNFPNQPWQPVVPASITQVIFDYACSK